MSARKLGQSSDKEQYSVRMLAAYMDVGGCILMEGEKIQVEDARVKGLRLETVIELEGAAAGSTRGSSGVALPHFQQACSLLLLFQ